MSDHKTRQPNKDDDLKKVKLLIEGASGEGFSLDDILTEYGSGWSSGRGAVPVEENEPEPGPDLPWPEAPRIKRPDNVVAFPGGDYVPKEEKLGEKWPEEPEPEDTSDEVIPFPEEESVLSAFLKDVGRRADDYADRMFAEDEATDHREVRRLERLIPGTDQEEHREETQKSSAGVTEPPPPDTQPQELVRKFGTGLKGIRTRGMLLLFLTLIALTQLMVPVAGLAWPAPLGQFQVQIWTAVALMVLGTLLAGDVLLRGIARAFRGRVGMDTLAALACVFTIVDGVMLGLGCSGPERLPFTAVILAGLWCQIHGTYHKRCAQRLSCRTAAASAEPYRVTLDEGKWNGRDTYAKWSGTAEGFGSQIQMDDGAQVLFRRVCPLLLLGDLMLALLATVGTGQPQNLIWGLSALFGVTAAFGGALVYGRSFHKVARRLSQSGGALAGWPGAANSRRGERVLITDTDLFPPGYVEMNGFKVLGNFPMERVVAYTATLIRDSGSGLTRLFHDQLRALGGLMRNAQRLCCYEGGGLSANIRGDQVLVGSAAFMNLMEISLPPGLNVKNAVFCAINGELAGIFALNYALPDTVFPALEELIGEKVGPVLATRDFNLIPAMLHQRFKLAADKMDFPPVERRRELSDSDQPHNAVLTALLCREGLYPFAEAVTAAKRLRWATNLGAGLCCVASLLGMVITAYLVSAAAFGSLSPLNLMIYMLTWLAPVWLLSGWVHRF